MSRARTERGQPQNVRLSIGGSVHDPTDPVGRLLCNVLAMVAEFESDLIRARTPEGMQVAKAKGRRDLLAFEPRTHGESVSSPALTGKPPPAEMPSGLR